MKKHLFFLVWSISLNGVHATPPEIIAQVIHRYGAGERITTITNDLGISKYVVYEYVRKAGIPVGRHRRRPRPDLKKVPAMKLNESEIIVASAPPEPKLIQDEHDQFEDIAQYLNSEFFE